MKIARSRSHDEMPVRTAALRVAAIMIVALVPTIAVYAYLAFRSGAWQMFVATGAVTAYFVITLFSVRLIRRGRVELGAQIIIVGISLGFLVFDAVVSGFGLLLGLVSILLALTVVAQVLSGTPARRSIWINVVLGVMLVLLDTFLPPYRLTLPELSAFVPIVLGALTLVYVALVARKFPHYGVRVKLLTITAAIASLVVLVVGGFAYTRIQQNTDLLSDELQAAVQQQAKQQVNSLVLQQATSANEFLQSMTTSVVSAGDYLQSILAQAPVLGQGEYWDANQKLTRVAAGQWDNPNEDAASVYGLSEVQLTDSLVSDINTAMHLDFVGPGLLRANPSAVALYYVSPDGITIYYPNIDLAAILTDNYDPRQRSYYTDLLPQKDPARNPIWSAPYQDSALTGLVVTVSAPVYDQAGQFRGVVAADVQLARLTEQVSRIRIGQTGYAFLIDSIGHVIAMPETGYADFGLIPEEVPPGETPKQSLLDQGSADLRSVTRRMASGEAGLATVKIGDVERYVAFKPLLSAGYSLGIVVPVNEMTAQFVEVSQRVAGETDTALRLSTLIFIAMLGVAVAVSMVMGRLLTAPLESLTQAAQKVTAGDLNVEAEIRTNDEYGTLSRAFNVMTARLRELVGSLELRIQARTEQLQAGADVARAVTSILDPHRLLPEVVNLIVDRFGFYYAAIFTLDEAGKFAVLREATGPQDAVRNLKERGHKLEVGGQSMVGYVTAQRKARIALDVGGAERVVRFANPLLPDTRSEIALPLVVGDRVIGALDVQSTQPGAFDEASTAALQAMADQIAVALNNAEQFRRAERQAQAQSNMLAAAIELTGQLDRDVLYDLIIRRAMHVLGSDGAGIWLPASADQIELVATIGAGSNQMMGRRLSKGEGMPGRAYATGRAIRANDYVIGSDSLSEDSPFHAAMCVPMTWQGHTAGVLAITHSDPSQVFDADDERTAQLFAAQAAAALVSANLAEEQRQTLEELDAANRRMTGEAWSRQFRRQAGDALTVEFTRSGQRAIEPGWLPEIEQAVTLLKPVAWARRLDEAAVSPFRSALAAPITLRGEVIGALQVGDVSQPRMWSTDDLAFIQSVADQVALAVDNARLIEETQRTAHREKTIAEAADKIHRPLDLEAILQAAVGEVSRITGLGGVSIQLGFGQSESTGGNGHTPIGNLEEQAAASNQLASAAPPTPPGFQATDGGNASTPQGGN